MNVSKNQTAYHRRIQWVVAYICAHLYEDLSVERLSGWRPSPSFIFVANSVSTPASPAQFIRLTRLKRAAYQLAFDRERKVVDIALDAGFSAPESFARAFKDAQGQTPSEFRRKARWESWAHASIPSPVRNDRMNPSIEQFEVTRVAVMEHRGPPNTLMSTVGRFIEWRKASGDSPIACCRTFGIGYDDPSTADPEAFRLDVCGELLGALRPNDAGVIEKVIPGGRCAVVRHVGSTDAIGETLRPLFAEWLPGSGESSRDFSCYFDYIERMPKVAEHEQVTDLYIPLI